jgi:hypothetical protein
VLEPSWRDDVTVIASLPLGVVAALSEELVRPVAVEVGSERHSVWFARRGTQCAQGARFLECTHLRVKADSPLRRDGRFVHHAGLNPGYGLGYMRHGAE